MISLPHITSEYGNNTGSCRQYAEYLLKDNDFFFNHSSSNISLDEAVALIDNNSKKRLLKTDAKWYAPVYALSEEEAQWIAYLVTERKVENYDDLSEEEKKKYNEYVVEFAKKAQDKMASNFNKSDLGINDGNNLFYIGVVENKRKYTFKDKKTAWSITERGQFKKGFNTHIHIIQSRLANNGKHTKISPMAKNKSSIKSNLGGIKGFDRKNFAHQVEQTFDNYFTYARKLKESFLYKNELKKGRNKKPNEENVLSFYVFNNGYVHNQEERKLVEKLKKEFLLSMNYIPIKEKEIPRKEVIRLEKQGSVLNYFDWLVAIGVMTKGKKDEDKDKQIFYTVDGDEIVVTGTKLWYNRTKKVGGSVVQAPQVFENINRLEAYNRLLEIEKMYGKEIIPLKSKSRKKSLELVNGDVEIKPYHYNYFFEIGISKRVLDFNPNIKAIEYKADNGKVYSSIAIKNNSGGFYTYNPKFNSYTKVGESDITYVRGKPNIGKMLVFDSYMDYVKYLQLKGVATVEEDIVILNEKANLPQFRKYLEDYDFRNYTQIQSFLSTDTYFNLKNAGVEIENAREKIGLNERFKTIDELYHYHTTKKEVFEHLDEIVRRRRI